MNWAVADGLKKNAPRLKECPGWRELLVRKGAMKTTMKIRGFLGFVGTMAAVALLGACAPPAEVAGDALPRAAELGGDDEIVYDISGGGRVRSTIERVVRADGSEVLYGRTEIGGLECAEGLVGAVVIEEVEIDAGGRMISADIALVSGEDEVEKRIHLDPAKGLVRIDGRAGKSVWRAPDDAPWAYAPLTVDGHEGAPIATPVAAWVTLGAVTAAPNARVIDVEGQRTDLIPADQLVVDDGEARFVVLGDEAIEADADFIVAM
jgi:hypothetical protein